MDATFWLAADIFQKLMAGIGFLAGAAWVVTNYWLNRTHFARLQVEVSAEFVRHADRNYLLATCQAKNVGLSIIRLPAPETPGSGPRGSALLVRLLAPLGTEPHMIEAPWSASPTVFDIFSSHQRIEPGLTITEQKLIYQPDLSCHGAWVQLRVSAHDQKWSAVAVTVLPKTPEEPACLPERS
jgi:hypothetical protein